MCGRYSLSSDPQQVSKLFGIDNTSNFNSRFNISPGQEAIAIYKKESKINMGFLNWGIKITTGVEIYGQIQVAFESDSYILVPSKNPALRNEYHFLLLRWIPLFSKSVQPSQSGSPT